MTFAAFFGLIAVTGLRVSEAIALDENDIDLERCLTVRRGKWPGTARSSYLSAPRTGSQPMPRSATGYQRPPPKSFFVSDTGNAPTIAAPGTTSHRLPAHRHESPQKFNQHGRGPRIHDLRHTFAARTMVNWYRTGKDPEREMIQLTTYLGHSEPAHTYWYIEAVPELLELASKRATRALAEGHGR